MSRLWPLADMRWCAAHVRFRGYGAHHMTSFWQVITRPSRSQRAFVPSTMNPSPKPSDRTEETAEGASVMTIESIIRRRAFRDGFYDGRQGCPMRRLATRKARWLYALGRIFANVAPTNVQVYEQRHATAAAVAAFSAMPVRYIAR